MKQFPIMLDHVIAWIPWDLIAPHEAQGKANRAQSLERLAERGGLMPSEAVAVLEDREWTPMDRVAARETLRSYVVRHASRG